MRKKFIKKIRNILKASKTTINSSLLLLGDKAGVAFSTLLIISISLLTRLEI
jgi:hypothetical protein